MPSVADRNPPPLPTPSSGRRIINRITSSLVSRPRNITDFYIQPDDPHKQYSPGDVVTGSVKLKVVKPIRVTHMRVCLHGYVQVYKNPNAPGDAHKANYIGIGRGDKHGEYFGSGFATLFEDEVVLCGDGRLAEGPYQFNFELLFPDKNLPSSLDFERGTISYLITATITRPTPINPTIECERKIFFLESIDIASLYPPKPRTVTLSPVSRRSKAKHTARKLVDSTERKAKKSDSATPSESQQTSRASESSPSNAASVQLESEAPQSPGPSEERFERDSIDGSSITDRYTQHSGSSENGRTTTSKSSCSDRIITTTMEVMQGGCLRGDYVPVKIQINHTKPIKSLYGIIITLFRHARVDMHPDIPLGPTEKGCDAKYEDYFPKSFSGLGGLSLSGAGSSHTYRKDLQQTFKPLMIDPVTLTTTVNAAIRVPEEAFPTMATVPGGMIVFKYYVEAVVDIQGKLASSDKGLSSLAGFTSPHVNLSDAYEGERSAFTPFGSNIIDTTPLKRHQGVINCTFEVVVGTRDSERRKGKRKLDVTPLQEAESHKEQAQTQFQAQERSQEQAQAQPKYAQASDPSYQRDQQRPIEPYYQYDPSQYQYADPSWGSGQWYWQPNGYSEGYDYWHQGWQPEQYEHYDYLPPTQMAPPSMPDETQMTEKERVRQHEMRLLPSQPPGSGDQAAGSSQEASAPYIPEESGPSEQQVSVGPSAPPLHAIEDVPTAPDSTPVASAHNLHLPDVPAYEPPQVGSSSHAVAVGATDDKQTMERPNIPVQAMTMATGESGSSTSSRVADNQPSATTLQDEGSNNASHDSHAEARESSELPVYER